MWLPTLHMRALDRGVFLGGPQGAYPGALSEFPTAPRAVKADLDVVDRCILLGSSLRSGYSVRNAPIRRASITAKRPKLGEPLDCACRRTVLQDLGNCSKEDWFCWAVGMCDGNSL